MAHSHPYSKGSLSSFIDRIRRLGALGNVARIFHVVTPQDSLESLATKYMVFPGTIRAYNNGLPKLPYDSENLEPYMGRELIVGYRLELNIHSFTRLKEFESIASILSVAPGTEFASRFNERGFLGHIRMLLGTDRYVEDSFIYVVFYGYLFSQGAPDPTRFRIPPPFVENQYVEVQKQSIPDNINVLADDFVPHVPLKDLAYIGDAPKYEDDVLPWSRQSSYKHQVRIGDVETFIPPDSIHYNKIMPSEEMHGLRSSTPIHTTSGQEKTMLSMTFFFAGDRGINGVRMWHYPEEGFEGQVFPYYMDGLRAFVAQAKAMPFLPIVNEYINEKLGIYAIAISNITVQPMPDFPDVFRVEVSAEKFNPYPYILAPEEDYGEFFIWPLFRWYYQRNISGRSEFLNAPNYYRGRFRNFEEYDYRDNSFNMKAINPDALLQITGNEKMLEHIIEESKYKEMYELYIEEQDEDGEKKQLPVFRDLEFEDMNITDTSYGLVNIISQNHFQALAESAHQYLGSIDDRIMIGFETTSENDVQKCREMQEDIGLYARSHQRLLPDADFAFVGYIHLDWSFTNFFGIKYCMLDAVEISTIPEFPGFYRILFHLRAYNPDQHRKEHLFAFELSKANSTFKRTYDSMMDHIEEHLYLEHQMNTVDLYPDLNLPSYRALQGAMNWINSFRRKEKLSAIEYSNVLMKKHPETIKDLYVEPDFYFAYPNLKDNYSKKVLKDSFQNLIQDGLQDIDDSYTHGEEKPTEAEIEKDLEEYLIDPEKASELKTVVAFENIPQPENPTDVAEQMFHDEFFYKTDGRMVKAFPTYLFMLIDEGEYIDGRKLFDLPFLSRALTEFTVHSEENNPLASCHIRLHDVYGATQAMAFRKHFDRGNLWNVLFPRSDQTTIPITQRFLPKINQEMIDFRRKQMLKKLFSIQPGIRVHLRAGYGNLGGQLPILFNGVLAEITRGEIVDLVAQSDGYQLTEPMQPFIETHQQTITNTALGLGIQPTRVLTNLLSYRRVIPSWFARGENESPLGINHFGYLNKRAIWREYQSSPLEVGELQIGVTARHDLTKNLYAIPMIDLKQQASDTYTRTELFHHPVPEDMNKPWSKVSFPTGDGVKEVEEKIQVNLFGKSFWDVSQTFAAINPDALCHPHYHQFRSTLFYGLPHWPVRYGFQAEKYGTGVRILERYKPYTQTHFASSFSNILNNHTTASRAEIRTIVDLIFREGNNHGRSVTLYADKRIRPDLQQRVTVHTDVVQDIGQFRVPIFGFTVDLVPDLLVRAVSYTPGERKTLTAGRNALRYFFAKMYRGNLTLIGNPNIKPYDIINLNDSVYGLTGNVRAGEVTHVMSIHEGFKTIVRPHLLSTTHNSPYSSLWSVLANCVSVTGSSLILYTTLFPLVSKIIKKDVGFKALKVILPSLKGAKIGKVLGLLSPYIVIAGLVYLIGRKIRKTMLYYAESDRTINIFPLLFKDRLYVAGITGQHHLIPYDIDMVDEEGLTLDLGDR